VSHRLMAKDVIHISEAETTSDFAALMARVRAGAKVIIENGARQQAVEPASVGIILDSSVFIAAERRGHTVREILEQVKAVQGNDA
jgi:CBS domain-containing protein